MQLRKKKIQIKSQNGNLLGQTKKTKNKNPESAVRTNYEQNNTLILSTLPWIRTTRLIINFFFIPIH